MVAMATGSAARGAARQVGLPAAAAAAAAVRSSMYAPRGAARPCPPTARHERSGVGGSGLRSRGGSATAPLPAPDAGGHRVGHGWVRAGRARPEARGVASCQSAVEPRGMRGLRSRRRTREIRGGREWKAGRPGGERDLRGVRDLRGTKGSRDLPPTSRTWVRRLPPVCALAVRATSPILWEASAGETGHSAARPSSAPW